MTPRQSRVLRALERAGRENPGGWACMRTLIHPQVGGNRAGARLYELRLAGVRLEKQAVCKCQQCDHSAQRARFRGEQPSRVSAWRLVDWERYRMAAFGSDEGRTA